MVRPERYPRILMRLPGAGAARRGAARRGWAGHGEGKTMTDWGDAAAAVAAVGTLLNGYFIFRLNQKFDRGFGMLTGRMDEQGENLRAHVNAPGLHGR